jgi:hypothetical protein
MGAASRVSFGGGAKAFQHVMKALTPAVGSTVRPGDADQGKLLGEHFAARKIVKRWYHQTLGQIAGGAKDDQRAGIGRSSLVLGWAGYQLCARWSPDRCPVKHGGVVSSGSQCSEKYAHHSGYQYAVSAGGALILFQREGIASPPHHMARPKMTSLQGVDVHSAFVTVSDGVDAI